MRTQAQQSLGMRGESLAAEFLCQQGYTELDRNVRIGSLEIDLLMQDPEGAIVVVEVKTLRISKDYDPIDAIDWSKRRQLAKSLVIMEQQYPDHMIRADGVTLYWVTGKAAPVITHLTDITSF